MRHGSLDAVMSIEALLFTPSKASALESAGFEVNAYDEIAGWRERETRFHVIALGLVDELATAEGVPPNELRQAHEEEFATASVMSRRVFAVAIAG